MKDLIAPPVLPQIEIPGYDILEILGRGGMGVVYKARQQQLNRLVALKTLRSGLYASPEELHRFQHEAEVIARLQHPNLIQIFEVGEAHGSLFLALEYVEGGTLDQQLDGTPWSAVATATLMEKLARAIDYSHQHGVVHRDLKPANILLKLPPPKEGGSTHPKAAESTKEQFSGASTILYVSPRDQTEAIPKITDFGLAKDIQANQGQTQSGAFMGTPSYAAPEQAAGDSHKVTGQTDVYSLGAILYELLTGSPPFRGQDMLETLEMVRHKEPVPPRQLYPKTPIDLETICLKCLRKLPTDRYLTAKDFADDLHRFLTGQPIAARPVGVLERTRKWVRRHPTQTGLILASLVAFAAVTAAIVAVAYQANLQSLNKDLVISADREKAARQEADIQRDAANEARFQLAHQRYVSDMTTAHRTWQAGDTNRMLSLLNRYQPKAGELDHRQFEWYYLRGLEQQHLWQTSAGGEYFHNGTMILADLEDKLRILDATTRNVVMEIERNPEFSIAGYASSRVSSRFLVNPTFDTIEVWDAKQKKSIQRLHADDQLLGNMLISDDGNWVAAAGTGSDHSLRIWEVATGKLQLHKTTGTYANVKVFSPDNQYLAFQRGTKVEILNLINNQKVLEIPLKSGFLQSMCYHPSGNWLFVTNSENQIQVFNVKTGTTAKPPFLSADLQGAYIQWSADGKRMLIGNSKRNTIELWNTETKQLLSQRKGLLGTLTAISLHPDGFNAITVSTEREMRIWDLRESQEVLELDTPFRMMRQLKYCSGKHSHLMVFIDEMGKLYLSDGKEHHTLIDQHDPISSYAFSPDGKTLVGASQFGRTYWWEVATGKKLHELQCPQRSVDSIVYNNAGTYVATVNFDKTIRIFDATNGRQLHQLPTPNTNNGRVKLYFQPGTDHLITAQSFDGFQRIIVEDQLRVEAIPSQLKTYELQFSPDGKFVAMGKSPLEVGIYRFPEMEQVHELSGHSSVISTYRFSPDGQRVATIAMDQTLKIWDTRTGDALLDLQSPANYDLAFRSDGLLLTTVGPNKITTWDISKSYQRNK
ncbi:MAG: serine/threonine-protein kinase [Zavarzinella sp.]